MDAFEKETAWYGDEVWRAAQDLMNAQRLVTIRAVQEKLGIKDIRGSARFICVQLMSWAKETSGSELTPMPDAVREALEYWVIMRAGGLRAEAEWRKVRLALEEWAVLEAEKEEKADRAVGRFCARIEREAWALEEGLLEADRRP